MAPRSIFRQPGAQHFQLVHRSQRDPLIHDPDAPQHVLKSFIPSNIKKGKSRADLEHVLSPSDLAASSRLGEASLYGIYYDDSQYDYMQHLRTVGLQQDGVDSVLIEAPSSQSKSKSKAKAAVKDVIPAEALPSASELPRNYESQEAVQSSIAGFQPDMDPHLRQALEALEDDAFVDDALEDDFFGELVQDGERAAHEDFAYEFREDGFVEGSSGSLHGEGEDEGGWETRFAKFKQAQKSAAIDLDSDLGFDDGNTEGGDTVGRLPKLPVIGGKRRRKGTSDASGYSMSSSSMFRTEALLTLDERFDQIMETEYAEDSPSSPSSPSLSPSHPDDSSDLDDDDDSPDLITTREDFEEMMDDFLSNYELLGRKLQPVLAGATPLDKLATLRTALTAADPTSADAQRQRMLDADLDAEPDALLMPYEEEAKKERWDCETILSTYSNLENHPRLIRARDNKPVPRIVLDPRTGLPSVADPAEAKPRRGRHVVEAISEEEEGEGEDERPQRTTITRPRDEPADAKKARKQAVKAERHARRADKKSTKEQFATEVKHQLKGIANKEKVKMRKL